MRFLLFKKRWQKTVIIILVLILFLGPIKTQVIRIIATISLSNILGTKVHIDKIDIGILETTAEISGLKVYNPEDFPEGILIDINKIGVQYDLPSILKGKLHFPVVILDLKEILIVKNQEGLLNVDSLKVIREGAENKKHKKNENLKPEKRMPLLINEAHLNLGKVFVKDYSKRKIPTVHGYSIGIKNKVYRNITSIPRLVTMIILEGVSPIGLKSAALYGASTALGVAFLPAGVAGVLIGKDTATGVFKYSPNKAFDKILKLLGEIGSIRKTTLTTKTIHAKVHASDVRVIILQKSEREIEIRVRARKMLTPDSKVAEGVLYQISQILK